MYDKLADVVNFAILTQVNGKGEDPALFSTFRQVQLIADKSEYTNSLSRNSTSEGRVQPNRAAVNRNTGIHNTSQSVRPCVAAQRAVTHHTAALECHFAFTTLHCVTVSRPDKH